MGLCGPGTQANSMVDPTKDLKGLGLLRCTSWKWLHASNPRIEDGIDAPRDTIGAALQVGNRGIFVQIQYFQGNIIGLLKGAAL